MDLETELLLKETLTDKLSADNSRRSSISIFEAKASVPTSRDSSRRSSLCQDQRLPPSGRSSVGPEIVSDEDKDESVFQTSEVY